MFNTTISNAPTMPMTAIPKNQYVGRRPIYFVPNPLVPDEVFLPLTREHISNIYPNRYFISNYGRVWDTITNNFAAIGYDTSYEYDGYNPGYILVSLAIFQNMYQYRYIKYYVHRLVAFLFDYNDNANVLEVNHKDGNHTNNYIGNLEWCTPQYNRQHAMENGFTANNKLMVTIELSTDQLFMIHNMMKNGLSDFDVFNNSLIPLSAINQFRSGRYYREFINVLKERNYEFKYTKPSSLSLPTDIVCDICRMLEAGWRIVDIMKKANVPRHVVNDIKAGRNYREISSQYNIPEPNHSIGPDVVHKICKLLEDGYEPTEIANIFNLPKSDIQSIKSKKTFTNISSKYNIPEVKKVADRVTDEKLIQIAEYLSNSVTGKLSDKKIADILGVQWYVVRDMRLRRRYKHISQRYVW